MKNRIYKIEFGWDKDIIRVYRVNDLNPRIYNHPAEFYRNLCYKKQYTKGGLKVLRSDRYLSVLGWFDSFEFVPR